jgi:predicted RNase H-like nuclease (RuvC/YqgF family)
MTDSDKPCKWPTGDCNQRNHIAFLRKENATLRASLAAKDAEIARLREALKSVEDIRPMWEGGVRGPSVAALENALHACRSIARAALAENDTPGEKEPDNA